MAQTAADGGLFPRKRAQPPRGLPPSPRLPPCRLAALGRPVPSSAVSDERCIIVGRWFPSGCERQSLLQPPPCQESPERGDGSKLGCILMLIILYIWKVMKRCGKGCHCTNSKN